MNDVEPLKAGTMCTWNHRHCETTNEVLSMSVDIVKYPSVDSELNTMTSAVPLGHFVNRLLYLPFTLGSLKKMDTLLDCLIKYENKSGSYEKLYH